MVLGSGKVQDRHTLLRLESHKYQVNGNVNIISRTEYDSLRLYYSDYGSTGSHIFYKPSDIYVAPKMYGFGIRESSR